MKRYAVATIVLGLTLLGQAASAAPTAGVRGRVIDKAGKPVEGVKIDMEFLGESRVKVAKSQLSDKRGGFVRMGIPDGKWKMTFTKEGYKTYAMEIFLSLGGFSETGDIVLSEGVPTAAAAAAAAPGAEVLPAGTESDKAGEAYAAAVEAAKAGKFEEAEAGLKVVIEKFPNLASAHFNLGYVYRMKKDWKGAEAEFLKVTEIEPAKPDAFIALAAVREIAGRGPEAAEAMIASAGAFEQDARFQYALGITCMNAGRTPEAEAAFRKALALDPANLESQYQLATILVGQAKTAEAIRMLEQYLAAAPGSTNAATAKALLDALQKTVKK